MILVNLLHFYQPINQQDDILDRIVNESYRPIVSGLLARPNSRININFAGSLLKLLVQKGYTDVIEGITLLLARGQIELTASAMYHPILPLLPKHECLRQIELNNAEGKKAFGDLYNPKGFFPPEMAMNDMVYELCVELGYSWVAAPTVGCPKEYSMASSRFTYKNSELSILFRNKPVSSLILSAQVRTAEDLIKETKDFALADKLWFTVMDAETFGHHRVGHEKLLFELLDSPFFDNRLGSDAVCDTALPSIPVSPIEGTWTNDEQDTFLQKGESPFTLWDDKANPIHKKQWELANFVVKELASFSDKESPSWYLARTQADVALASDQFWWASAKPWWSLEMIESGAFDLKQVILTLFKSSEDKSKTVLAETLYNEILAIAFEWQRSGYIRKRHSEESTTHRLPPLKDRTSAEWFNQLVLEFEKEMNDAVLRQDFERAIKWRDAVIKISLGTDKHDILHVVDELWLGRNVPWAQPQVKPFLAHSWVEFSDFAKAHFLDVASQEDFENWQKSKS